MPVTISGDGVFAGLTTVETVDVKHPDSEDVNIVLADDGSVTLDSIPASIQSAIDGIPQIAGIGSNVVQTVKTDTFTTTSATAVDVTGLSVTITPSSATAKVLLIVQWQAVNTSASNDDFTLRRGSTDIYLADSETYSTKNNFENIGASNIGYTIPFSLVYLDSPASASAQTYVLRARRQLAGTLRVGSSGSGGNKAVSSITAIEVAA